MRVAGERRSRQQVEQRFAHVCRAAVAQHLVFRKNGLEFDCVGARFRRGVDEVRCDRDVSVVIDARFRNHEAGMRRPNETTADLQRLMGHEATTGSPELSKNCFCVYSSSSLSRFAIDSLVPGR